MTAIESIERAVEQLPVEELSKFREWFVNFDEVAWDAQIESDATAGKLDALAEEALKEYSEGKTRRPLTLTLSPQSRGEGTRQR